jgi:hypothetical protein
MSQIILTKNQPRAFSFALQFSGEREQSRSLDVGLYDFKKALSQRSINMIKIINLCYN